MRYLLILLLPLICHCSSTPDPDYEVNGVNVYCLADECPTKKEVKSVMTQEARRWGGNPWKLWERYRIVFEDETMCYYRGYTFTVSNDDCGEGRQYYGATWHNKGQISLWIPRWEDAMPWELSLVIAEHHLPGSNELEKIEWLSTQE